MAVHTGELVKDVAEAKDTYCPDAAVDILGHVRRYFKTLFKR